MSTHTPGPWREGPTEGIGQRGKLIVVDANGFKIADCEADKVPGSIAYTRSLSEDTANARLIAAAPELFAELKEKLCGVECACCFRARLAIAKVEGR